MRNKEKWEPTHFQRDSRGKFMGTHMHKIIGHAYEKVIKEHSSGILADVGCGRVPYYSIYKDLVKDNICIDWSDENEVISFLDHIADLNKEIPLESKIVDTVLCTDVLEHINNPGLLFSEMARIMRKDAKIIITVPFMYWIHNPPHDHHRYTKYMLKEYCCRNKLQVISIEEYGGLPEIMYDLIYKGYIYYNFPMRRPFLFFWKKLGLFLYRRGFVKRLSMSSREIFPLGYILVAQKES